MPSRPETLVVVGGSAGALEALEHVLGDLPETFDAAMAIVLHTSMTSRGLASVLTRLGILDVYNADHGQVISRGLVVVAPPGRHLLVNGTTFELGAGAVENRNRPAIDPLFRSAARTWPGRLIGVVLS